MLLPVVDWNSWMSILWPDYLRNIDLRRARTAANTVIEFIIAHV